MIIVDEFVACCDTGTYPEGCGKHQKRKLFSDERRTTLCDECKWRLKIEKDRIAETYGDVLAAATPDNVYQRAARAEQITNREIKRENYIAGATRLVERGEKVTIKSIAVETGYSQSDVYNYFPTKPCRQLTELAEQCLREQEAAHA
jgi:hypothetical protein